MEVVPSSQVQNQESIAQFGEVVVSTTEIVTGFLLLGGEVVNVNPALGIEQAGSGVAVGVAVGVASGSGVGAGVALPITGAGSVSIWLVADFVNVTACDPPKKGARIGVRSWKWPTTDTVTRLPNPVEQSDGEHVFVMSPGVIVTPDAFASSRTRHTTRLDLPSAGQPVRSAAAGC